MTQQAPQRKDYGWFDKMMRGIGRLLARFFRWFWSLKWKVKGPAIAGALLVLFIAIGAAGGGLKDDQRAPVAADAPSTPTPTGSATTPQPTATTKSTAGAGASPTPRAVPATPPPTTAVSPATSPAAKATVTPTSPAPAAPTPAPPTAVPAAPTAVPPTPLPPTQAPQTDGHTWYTSSASNANRYYCDLDPEVKSLSQANLLSYPSEAALNAAWGSRRTKSPNSNC